MVHKLTAGIDEVGRGTIAGPVVAAAVILDNNCIPSNLDDSKKITSTKRKIISDEIFCKAVTWAISYSDASEIDSINILQATMLAMRRSILNLGVHPSSVSVDGNKIPNLDFFGMSVQGRSIIGGDGSVAEISAASIIAKVYRDNLMINLDKVYPGYFFSSHKGYGTKEHLVALSKYGPIDGQHRFTFEPVKRLIRT